MRGFKITCTASSYRDRELIANKGWTLLVAEADPLVGKLRVNPAFKIDPCEVPDDIVLTSGGPAKAKSSKAVKEPEIQKEPETPKAPPAAPSEADDIANVPGIPAALIPGIKARGYDTIAKVLEAGVDALDEIEGIGPPTAHQILLACSEYLGE